MGPPDATAPRAIARQTWQRLFRRNLASPAMTPLQLSPMVPACSIVCRTRIVAVRLCAWWMEQLSSVSALMPRMLHHRLQRHTPPQVIQAQSTLAWLVTLSATPRTLSLPQMRSSCDQFGRESVSIFLAYSWRCLQIQGHLRHIDKHISDAMFIRQRFSVAL